MNDTLKALYEQMDFVPIANFKTVKRIGLQELKDYENWDVALSGKISLKETLPFDNKKSFSLILEFIKEGNKQGYVLLSMPVLVDIPYKDDNKKDNKKDNKSIFLVPDISEAVSLNSEYYLHEMSGSLYEKQANRSEIQLNDQPFSLEDLSESFDMGISKPYFEKAKAYLYESANVTSFEQLVEKIKTQLRYQHIIPKFSLVERVSDASKIHLLKLYKGLMSDGYDSYASSCLPRLLSVYENSNSKIECSDEDVYKNFLDLRRDTYDEPSRVYRRQVYLSQAA